MFSTYIYHNVKVFSINPRCLRNHLIYKNFLSYLKIVVLKIRFIFNSESIPLSHKVDDTEWPFVHHAEFTTKGHSLIIVYNYDIYYRLGPRTYQSFRVTNDAIPGIVYNGIPDWLYEGKYDIQFSFPCTFSIESIYISIDN